MNNFKITFEDNNTITTEFNGNLAAANNYFLNNTFNLGNGENDLMVKVILVEQLN